MTGRCALFVLLAAACCAGIAQPSQTPAPNAGAAGLLERATKLLLHKQYAEAEQLLRGAVAADATHAQARFMLAYALFREDKPADSLQEYTRAAQLRTPSAHDLKWVAEDYVLLNDFSDAAKWMNRSVEMDPNDEQAWYALGRIYYTQNAFAQAERCFEHALRLNPRDERAENNLGLTYEAFYQMDDAVKAYRAAIEWQKDSPSPDEQPYLNLGTVLLHQNNLTEADPMLTRAAAISPDDPKVLTELALLHAAENQLPLAENELRRAAEKKPADAAIHFQLGRLLHREGKAQEAKAEFDRAAALNGSHSSPER